MSSLVFAMYISNTYVKKHSVYSFALSFPVKPKTPTIRSANLTTAGKTNVTWLTNYEKTSSKSTLRFLEDLKTELYYKPQKGGEWVRNVC